MQKSFLVALLLILIRTASAQTPQVPHKIHFAGLTLTVRDDARREIQKDVDALTQSPRHFNIKAERARTYFPIIEKIFEEEGVPDDFKFLVLQESALISDAVSVSKAVGFWQFKDFTAAEMGLRVDKEVDERMNLVASTRAAAKYIKKNNFYFNNWLYALQAYQMGAGGVMRSEKDSQSGESHIEITSKTYWYVKKYLAHKIAFEDAVKAPGAQQILTYESRTKRTLDELADEVAVEPDQLKEYNKWALKGRIPDDKPYMVIIPVSRENADRVASKVPSFPAETKPTGPRITPAAGVASANEGRIKINGLAALQARNGEDARALASRGGVELSFFLKCNELSVTDRIQPGKTYFIQKKRNRANEAYYTAQQGESLWDVSQKFGVKTRRLEHYNRMRDDQRLQEGQVVWLASRKPKTNDSVTPPAAVLQVDDDQTFNWSSSPPAAASATLHKDPVIKKEEEPVVEKTDNNVTPAPIETITDVPLDSASSTDELVKKDSTVQPVVSMDSVVINAGVDTVKRIPLTIKPREHTVKQGETLYGIARLYEIEVMDLVAWNNLNLQEAIKPGQILTLVGPETKSDSTAAVSARPTEIIHEVKASDTLYSVARKYNVTIKELMDWNGKKDFTVAVGEKLRIMRK